MYEFLSQNKKFAKLNTEFQPVKEHALRKRKNFQTDLNLRFFSITAKRNKNKISCGPSIFSKGVSLFVSAFFIFHPNDSKLWHLPFE